MGLFSLNPRGKREQRVYDQEKASALKTYNAEKQRARTERIKAQARLDALPRGERARQRLSRGLNALKTGASKLKTFDAKMDARAKAQGHSGGIITQGYRQDLRDAAQAPPLLAQTLARDQQQQGTGVVQESLRGPQGEGLIISNLRQQGRRR